MKKGLLTLAILTILSANASEFNIIINKKSANYEIGSPEGSPDIRYTEWTPTSTANCTIVNDWNPSEVYKGHAYDKTSTCDEDQERFKETYENDVLIKSEKETRFVNAVERKESLVGELAARNCLEVLNSHGSVGDGNYTLTVNGTEHSNYCDMTNGGWTLAMRLKNSGQLSTGDLNRDNFWNSGSTMLGYRTNKFNQMELTDTGFLGWDRIDDMLNNSYLEMNIRGTNSLNQAVDEKYTLNNFAPNMTNTTIETGSIAEGGTYTISKKGDVDTRNGWGSCGTKTGSDVHVGLGLCVTGYNTASPNGKEVQIWHYGASYGNYSNNMNVSFGHSSSGNTYNYNKNVSFDLKIFIK